MRFKWLKLKVNGLKLKVAALLLWMEKEHTVWHGAGEFQVVLLSLSFDFFQVI